MQNEEALAMQLRLEQGCDAAGVPDQYDSEENFELYELMHDSVKAEHYTTCLQSTTQSTA